MKKFEFYAPTEIVFGPDTESRAGEMAKLHGATRVFIVYGSASAVKSGLIERVEESMKDAGIAYLSSGGVVPNPLLSTAERMKQEAIDFQADFILAVGGGSVIDTAKAVAIGVANPEVELWKFWTREVPLQKSLPIGSVLTISAAGSEMSDTTVISNDVDYDPPTKRGLGSRWNRPKFAILNPNLTMTLPKWQIGAGAADIFMHTSERFFAPIQGNHLTDEIAASVFRNIITFGPRGVKNPSDYEAMSEIMWTGSISHNTMTGLGAKGDTPREGDWACHQLGMAISAIYDSTHGATLSAVWPAWCRYVRDADIHRFAMFAQMVYGIQKEDMYMASEMAIEQTVSFFRSLGMPVTLTELLGHRPTEEELEALTDECTYGNTRTIGSFKILERDDILAIYREACDDISDRTLHR